MPKENKNDKKKQELERLIKEIKENAPEESKSEIEELEKVLEEVLKEETKPLGTRILNQVSSFFIHTVFMYIASLLVFGFFFTAIEVENKFLVFLFGAIISVVLVLFERIPRNPFRKHFILINLMIFAIIVIGFCIVNQDVYRVFSFTAIWIFYFIIVEVIYLLFEHTIINKYILT